MHIRTSRVTRNGKTHEYAQLVESYRRPSDGTPAHRVIATLGAPGDVAVENFRAALAAARAGKRVALVRQGPSTPSRPPKPTANLRYLDIAVLLELWREWGLDGMLDELMPQGEARLRPSSVVAALVLQRCVDPGSKLFASRWLPRTALPELLDLAPDSFNNTRLHRVLDDLDTATGSLMAKLPKRYEQRDGAFASLFLDVTDTWFVGDGPALAKLGKTKEGRLERKIGIVLLCNEHGYPLRWDVIQGTQHDSVSMTAMCKSVAGLRWVGEAPVVCDRAMGRTAQVREMLATKLRFLTALTVTEFDAYATQIPHAPFAELHPADDAARKQDIQRAARCAESNGMQRVEDDLFVLDMGIVERADVASSAAAETSDDDVTVAAMRACRQVDQDVAQGRYSSYAAAGRPLGLSKSLTAKYRQLRTLSEQQQRDILEGKVAHCPLSELIAVAGIDEHDARNKAFDTLLKSPGGRLHPSRKPATTASSAEPTAPPIRVRVVAYFNPVMFVEQRKRAREHLDQLQAFVANLNAKLAAPRSRHTRSGIAALVDRRLRQQSLLDAFDVRIDERSGGDRPRYQVQLTRNRTEWANRRRYDGFTVLVGHPELTQSPANLCRLYRAKDAVEKDFQVIKSVIELRPVWHHTEAKVRSHVTLCMLALLLERTLRRKLLPFGTSVEAALASLEPCRLNSFAANHGPGAYCITQLDTDQRAILKSLRLLHLADDDDLADKIHPREGVVTTPEANGRQK